MKNTQYRIIPYNGVRYLQYKKRKRFLFFSWEGWSFVPYQPEWNYTYFYRSYVNTDNGGCQYFVTKYPNIQDYFEGDYIKMKKHCDEMNKVKYL